MVQYRAMKARVCAADARRINFPQYKSPVIAFNFCRHKSGVSALQLKG